ncbi:unnamed protein product [Symbiodinium necroappetens]|uniref:Uncharacterized protein n=1 Tax=Symbiodinium necroappetens TaxID=1628268 RepID=A0A812QD29_9DINO|nr:unnamed protein product [Symbiodinium necroappetens]
MTGLSQVCFAAALLVLCSSIRCSAATPSEEPGCAADTDVLLQQRHESPISRGMQLAELIKLSDDPSAAKSEIDVPSRQVVDINIGTNLSPMKSAGDNFLLQVDPLPDVCDKLKSHLHDNKHVAVLCCAASGATPTSTSSMATSSTCLRTAPTPCSSSPARSWCSLSRRDLQRWTGSSIAVAHWTVQGLLLEDHSMGRFRQALEFFPARTGGPRSLGGAEQEWPHCVLAGGRGLRHELRVRQREEDQSTHERSARQEGHDRDEHRLQSPGASACVSACRTWPTASSCRAKSTPAGGKHKFQTNQGWAKLGGTAEVADFLEGLEGKQCKQAFFLLHPSKMPNAPRRRSCAGEMSEAEGIMHRSSKTASRTCVEVAKSLRNRQPRFWQVLTSEASSDARSSILSERILLQPCHPVKMLG